MTTQLLATSCHGRCICVASQVLHHVYCPNHNNAELDANLPRQKTVQTTNGRFDNAIAQPAAATNEAMLLLSVGGPTAPVRSGLPRPLHDFSFKSNESPSVQAEKLFRAAAETLLSISPSLSPKNSPVNMPPAFNLSTTVNLSTAVCSSKKSFVGNASSEEVADFDDDLCKADGRIGIYAPAQRRVLLAKFAAKRKRRRWDKKVRYNCRKNLADSRLRVKGRFVKKSELAAQAAPVQPIAQLAT